MMYKWNKKIYVIHDSTITDDKTVLPFWSQVVHVDAFEYLLLIRCHARLFVCDLRQFSLHPIPLHPIRADFQMRGDRLIAYDIQEIFIYK